MTVATHTCFFDGTKRLGSSYDCPKCWDALERSVDLDEARREDPEIFHHTTADTYPEADGGGWWSVRCTCGWTRSGHYLRDEGEPVALRLADLKGAEHETNPDKRCAYCGHPEREACCTFCKHSNQDRRPHHD